MMLFKPIPSCEGDASKIILVFIASFSELKGTAKWGRNTFLFHPLPSSLKRSHNISWHNLQWYYYILLQLFRFLVVISMWFSFFSVPHDNYMVNNQNFFSKQFRHHTDHHEVRLNFTLALLHFFHLLSLLLFKTFLYFLFPKICIKYYFILKLLPYESFSRS